MISRIASKHWPFMTLLFGILFVGCAAIFTRLADCNPIASAFWRSAFALPLFLFFSLQAKNSTYIKNTDLGSIIKLILVGMIFGIDIALWNASLNYTSIANAGFLSSTTPIFMILATWIFAWHKLNIGIWLGLITTLLGAALMTLGSLTPELHWLGDSLAMLSAILFAAYIFFIAHFRQKLNLWIILLYCDLGACLILALASFVLGQSLAIENTDTLIWLIALSLISQVLGQGLITTGLKYFSPPFSAVALTLTPVISLTGAWFIFQESLTILQGMGIILIAFGVYFSKKMYHKPYNGIAAIRPTNDMIKFDNKRMDKI